MKILIPLYLGLMVFLPIPLRADIEPSKGDLLTVYVVGDVEGTGDLQVLKEGQNEWKRIKEGEVVEEGDRLKTGKGCEAILALKKHTFLHLDEGSEISVPQLSENQSGGFLSKLELWTGAILSDVKKNLTETQSSFEVESGGVVCGVRGTVFEVGNNRGSVSASTQEGAVQMTTPQGNQTVKAGQTCSTSHGKAPSLHPMSKGMKARFMGWKGLCQRMRQKMGQRGGLGSPGGQGGLGMLGRSPAAGGRAGGPHAGGALPPARPSGHR